jgi:exo-1,4-beta-D-glucosaminidase
MSPSRWSTPWVLLLVGLGALAPRATAQSSRVPLQGNWTLQSSCQIKAAGGEIAKAGFDTTGWHRAEVPTTVIAALLADKTYGEPFFGKNLKSIPGMNYSDKEFFSSQPMPEGSPFHCSWWFRTEFTLSAAAREKTTWLHFDGINYRANVWLNGQKIADAKDVAGTFRLFDFDVTKLTRGATPNALAVEVFAPEKDDLALTWVDWNPTPADKDMGLWKDVYLATSGDVSLRHPFVASKLDERHEAAALTLSADLQNVSSRRVEGMLRAELEGVRVSEAVVLAPGESKTVSLTPDRHPELRLAHPRLWWPYTMGTPSLYTAKLAFESGGQTSDSAEVRFGIREVTSELTAEGHRLFRVNGRKVLIRGGAWAPDMFLRWSPRQADAALRYTHDMGLNAIRLEGRMERDEFFDEADELGVLIMPGWTCCDMWEKWDTWKPEHHQIAGASMADQARRLRNHPSVFVWLYGSDGPPPADVEKMYLQVLKEHRWPNPTLSSASENPTTVTGASGVKMTGPYEYVPPNYWLTDKEAGGAHGYNTETSPGPAIPPLESLKRFIPPDHLWPIDDFWNYHAGGERFTTIGVFASGVDRRYGKAESLEDFLRKAQAMTYEGQRAMFEAYGRNKYVATGVIQWMLNNAWPSIIWHLYDYYLVPAGGYFGTKKACEPVHVQYSYDDHSVAVVNAQDRAFPGMKVVAKLYSVDAKEIGSREGTLDVPPDSSTKAFPLPAVGSETRAYFLRLQLRDSGGKLTSENFYWLSTKPDVLDWAKKQDTVYTPQSDYADLSPLSTLPKVAVTGRARVDTQAADGVARVTLENPSASIAFMVRARLTKGKGGEDVTPIFWDDNYVSLLPGEKREIVGRFAASALSGTEGIVEVDGWNVAAGPASAGAP